jgi:hypothetical protein
MATTIETSAETDEAAELARYASRFEHETRAFADALQRNNSQLLASNLVRPALHRRSPAGVHAQQGQSLGARTESTKQVSLEERSAAEQNSALSQYQQQMAEAALTRNGRDLKSKATTKVFKVNQVCYASSYTRKVSNIFRDLLVDD